MESKMNNNYLDEQNKLPKKLYDSIVNGTATFIKAEYGCSEGCEHTFYVDGITFKVFKWHDKFETGEDLIKSITIEDYGYNKNKFNRIDSMTNEQIDRAIAKHLCLPIDICKCGDGPNHWIHSASCDYAHMFSPMADIPEYSSDLNVMHEAEKTLDVEQQRKYAAELGQSYDGSFAHVTATAHQRAVVFLRTVGKWKDEINDQQMFSEELLARATMNDAESQAFREVSTKHTMKDSIYGDSITFYRNADGVVMFDSYNSKREDKQ